MTEEQGDEGSTNVEPRVIAEGRSSEIEGEVLEGASTLDLMNDDKYRMVAIGSIISTSGGGISMGVGNTSSSIKSKLANKGEVDSLCLA